eukprot:301272-Rhodomonas_salina.2
MLSWQQRDAASKIYDRSASDTRVHQRSAPPERIRGETVQRECRGMEPISCLVWRMWADWVEATVACCSCHGSHAFGEDPVPIAFDKYHPGYFGKVGMRYFHYKKNPHHMPTINVDKLWSMRALPSQVGLEQRKEYAKKSDGTVPLLDVTAHGFFKVCSRSPQILYALPHKIHHRPRNLSPPQFRRATPFGVQRKRHCVEVEREVKEARGRESRRTDRGGVNSVAKARGGG